MTLAEHIQITMEQLKSGNTIGRRQTPVISFWPMRKKWEKYTEPFSHIGTDGDMLMEDGYLVIPASLQLVYFRVPQDLMCQLAYMLEPESRYRPGQEDAARNARYDAARFNLPKPLDN